MLRLVLDTNTILSGLLWSGVPSRLITAAQNKEIEEIALYCSQVLLDELHGVIRREKFIKRLVSRNSNAEALFNGYAALCQRVEPR